jgi:hypothetical protein
MGMARITLDDGTYVRVIYSRPYQRGRDNIFGTEESGALVPFGQIWLTGADEATEITVAGDVLVANELLPAGTYQLLATPGAEEWKIHFNSPEVHPGIGGLESRTPDSAEGYVPENNVLTVTAESTAIDGEEVDQFTISFDRTETGADMVMRWAKTEVRVPFGPVRNDGTGGGGDPCYLPKCKCSDGSCSEECCDR